ncbi:cytochrome o ubiquinol oxidase subunit IV [Methylomonas sp. MgM2]
MNSSSTESTRRYLIGFALALGLTVLAFALVGARTGFVLELFRYAIPALPDNGKLFAESPRWIVLTGIFVLAVLQVGVHLHYFLHLDFSRKQRLLLHTLLFSLLIVFILVCGTLWIMHDLNRQMLPS